MSPFGPARLFAIDVDPADALPATYDALLVTVSFFVAALAGFAFIRLSHRIAEQPPSPVRLSWMFGGALTMGLGIWAMHFVGMLAYQLPIAIAYDPLVTAGSAVPAVLASAWTLQIVARSELTRLRLIGGGVVLGGGIGTMHYSGMAALELNAFVRYDPLLFAASIGVAVLLAVAALWIAHWLSRPGGAANLRNEALSALLIGLAVAGMHYTAMSSTLCFATSGVSSGASDIDPAVLAGLTTVVATMILVAAIGAVFLDRRLQRQERRLQLIMDNVADAVLTLDADGRIDSFNRAAEQIFGFAAADVLGRHVSMLLRPDEEGGDSALALRLGSREASAELAGRGVEVVGHHRNGESIHLEAMFSTVEEHGRTVLVGALRDIGERIRHETALRFAKDEAERANRAKTEFISHMSHELRTPLNAVIGLADALRRTETLRTDPERLTEYLADIRASGEHLLALVNDVLDISAIETGGRAIRLETFDVGEEVESVIRPLKSSIHSRRVSIEVAPPPGEVMVVADRQSFRQVLLNLAGNAVNHGGDGVAIRIEIDGATSAEFARVTIADNGPGMPEELLRAIGQPFPQVRTPYVRPSHAPHAGGTGLGLFIVSQLMMLNGGRFDLDSAVGDGTQASTFWQRAARPTEEGAAAE